MSRYQQDLHSPALDAIAKTHADAGTDRDERLLLTTWFLDGDPRVAMMSSVRPDGHVSAYRYVHDWSVQNSTKSDLVADQVLELRGAIDHLPASQSPPLAKLLIVSFRRNGRWLTRTYDRTALPGRGGAGYSPLTSTRSSPTRGGNARGAVQCATRPTEVRNPSATAARGFALPPPRNDRIRTRIKSSGAARTNLPCSTKHSARK